MRAKMKAITKLITTFIAILLLASCATASRKIPKKYDLDRQLVRVSKISDFIVGREKSAYNYDYYLAVREYQKHREDENYQPQIPPPVYASNYQLSEVDEQSLIFRCGPDKNYLLVLEWPVSKKLFKLGIRIVTSSFTINVKTDFVLIGEGLRCPIERIYMIGDDEHAAMIRNQLLGNPKNYFPPQTRKHI